jgi:hypothetical protein
MDSEPRAEPRWVTLADLMVAVAGWAVGYAVLPFTWNRMGAMDVYGTTPFMYVSVFQTARRPLLVAGFTTAVVAIVRQARFRRTSRPAEWPALVLAASLASTVLLGRAYDLEGPGPFGSWPRCVDEWPWAAAWLLLALVGLVLPATRWQMPPWARTVVLTAVVAMWFCGPAHVYREQAAESIPRAVGPTNTWPFQLRWSLWMDRGRWPELIVFGVAIAAGLRDRVRAGGRVRTWTEYAGLTLGLAFAGCWWLDRLAAGDPANPACAANMLLRGGWVGAIGLAGWLIVRGRDAVRDRRAARPDPGRP